MLLASSEAGVQHLASLSADEYSAWRQKSNTALSAKL
jgi:hypothetical protein